ncbi:actin-like ATPase domain-containing protein [Hesseltinella vesiculosa]|uniref:Actin-like ATPase domain-containing protein n=1 Tax=Hesseltinella vesiculosa TaxID=101127 RepID=A0A1X2GSQ7_9FUNG|nr:actin-like ATPase domain-containing protein [Hesseltinella vesiculosa]
MAPSDTLFNASDYPVVVGIDFGTTYSGAAFAMSTTDNEVHDIKNWPRRGGYHYPKVPTISLYDRNTRQLVTWGNGVIAECRKNTDRELIKLQQFKLYLDESLGMLKIPEGFNAVDLIADYLKVLHEHIKTEMKRTYVGQMDCRYRYCLTVPAMWTDKAKQIMRDASVKAGIIEKDDHHDRLMLISEPEAAAIYCERTSDDFTMVDGDEFMICDAGGGTLDLIVFGVKMDADGNRTFQESTEGMGRSCGSIFIDKGMKKLLKSKLKKISKGRGVPDAALETMMEHFIDRMKPDFDGTEEQYLDLPMNAGVVEHYLPAVGLQDGKLTFTVEELKQKVFEPVVKDVLDLLHQQLKMTTNLKAIFMVGGFGSSQYLYHRVNEEFSPLGVKVVTPNRGELAVARGAVYAGLNPTKVSVRVPRYWYGIEITAPFVEGVDPPHFKITNPDGTVRSDHRFSIFVRRGEPLPNDHCISKRYTTFYPRHTACTFFACENEQEPRWVVQEGVRKVFDFEIPMPNLPGVAYGEPVELTINMYFGEVELRVEAIIRDKKYDVLCNFNV